MDEEDLRRPTPRVRLRFMKSPVIGSTDAEESVVEPELPGIDQWHKSATLGAGGFATYRGEAKGLPIFRKFEDASLLELFTDLFFAANYTVFTQTQQVTDSTTLASYIGYFGTLWITWLIVALYDVRFVTDCVFERVTRAVHLGVLIGFAVVAPKFDPSDQDRDTMRIMSIILSVSRFCLGLEYLSVLWHIRKFKKALLPIGLQAAFSFAVSFVYLGITFRFRDYNSRVFVAWYIIAAFELTVTTGASAYWDVLSFTRTHLMKRLSLLTVIILGDGIIVLAQDLVVIVQTPNAWNPLTIGVVTASCAAIYCVFLVYFDWIREQYLPRWRQLYWVCLHLPFHLALVLFMHGFTQLIMWTKIFDVLTNEISLDNDLLTDYDRIANSTSADIANDFGEMVGGFFHDYGKLNSFAMLTFSLALANITELPNSTWSEHPRILEAAINDQTLDGGFHTSETFLKLQRAFVSILTSMYASLFETYGIEVTEDLAEDRNWDEVYLNPQFSVDVFSQSVERFEVVFIYGYIASGLTLIMMVLLAVISRKHPWTTWPIVRNVVNVVCGILMACLAALVTSDTFGASYILNGMTIPTMTIIWFFVLVLTHIGAATPVVNEVVNDVMRKKSTSPEREEAKRQGSDPSDQRSMSWHGGGGVAGGNLMHDDPSERMPQQASQTSFYGQIGEDGTGYGRPFRYSHDQDHHEGAPTHGLSSSSTANNSESLGTSNRRGARLSPASSSVSPGYGDQNANVSPASYMD